MSGGKAALMKMPCRVFSVGECPVCPGFGTVLALARQGTQDLVFFCPACGCAWEAPPGESFDEAHRLSELAPGGVRLPKVWELARLSEEPAEVDAGPWASDLEEVLRSS